MITDDVTDPAWWAARVRACGGDLQRAQYIGTADAFSERHRDQMAQLRRARIGPTDSVLDAGCGYGRLLTMMPAEWKGHYIGVDFCDEFVKIARVINPDKQFMRADLTAIPLEPRLFDVAVCVWLKTMMEVNDKMDVWRVIEAELRRVAKRVVIID